MPSALLSRSLLTAALLGSLAACSPGPSSEQETLPSSPSASEPAPDAQVKEEGLEDLPELPQPALSPDQAARINDITVELRATGLGEAFEVKTAGKALYVDLKPGEKFLFCIGNRNNQAALASVSLQGENIDLVAAHTHRPLLRLSPLTTRCLPGVIVAAPEENKPALVAWNVFLAEGEDGASIQDTSVVPAQSGRIWIGKPINPSKMDPWPALKPQPVVTPTAPSIPSAPVQTP